MITWVMGIITSLILHAIGTIIAMNTSIRTAVSGQDRGYSMYFISTFRAGNAIGEFCDEYNIFKFLF
jgi:hypothetical protein